MSSCKVAFVGAGYMASEHVKAFAGLPGVELTGIFSRTRARAEKLALSHPYLKICNSIAELHAQTGADLVVVTVNELSMNAVATQCFAYPWTVLLEKPAGYNLPDSTAIVEESRRANNRTFVALNRRAYSSTRIALDRLEGNAGPRFITVQDQQDQDAALNVHRNPRAVVENYMYANSIHVIDYFRIFGRGEITKVAPIAPWDPKQPGTVLAHIVFSSGDSGLYEGIWNGPGPWAVTINTPRERLEMRPLEQVSVQARGERKLLALPADPLDSEFKPGLRYQAEQAILAASGKPSRLPTLDDSWRSMQLVAAIFGLSA